MDWSSSFEQIPASEADASPATERRSRRAPVLLAGTVEVDRRKKPVKIRNFSSEGALIEGDALPKEGSTSVFTRNDLRLKVKVVWVQGRYAGIAFERPLDADEVLRHVPQPRARQAQDFKRPGLACRPLTSYERRMIEHWLVTAPVVETKS